MDFFIQLHVRLSFDELTMGVLCHLIIAPIILHQNNRGGLHAFWLISKLCICLLPLKAFFIYMVLVTKILLSGYPCWGGQTHAFFMGTLNPSRGSRTSSSK